MQTSFKLIHVKAKVRFKTAEEGGRTTGILSGYRPNHVFEYEEDGTFTQSWIGDIQFSEPEMLELGKEYELTVRFLWREQILPYFQKGRKWGLYEGDLQVGEGEILDFMMPEK